MKRGGHLEKALQHKYIRRYRGSDGKYRYVYVDKGDRHGEHSVSKEKLSAKDEHFHEGASFSAGAGLGHYQILRREGNSITFRLDEGKDGNPGEKQTLSLAQFKKMVADAHGQATKAHAASGLAKRIDILKRAKKVDPHSKHTERARSQVSKWMELHQEHLSTESVNEAKEHLAITPQKLSEEQARIATLEDRARKGELSKAEIDQLGRIRKKPISPQVSVALSPTKKHSFHVKYRVVDLFDLVTSHKLTGGLNEAYDQALQSRHRGSLVDTQQIAQMAAALEPMALLYDSRRTDEGSPIIGEDNMVESGNGRTMALMFAANKNSKS